MSDGSGLCRRRFCRTRGLGVRVGGKGWGEGAYPRRFMSDDQPCVAWLSSLLISSPSSTWPVVLFWVGGAGEGVSAHAGAGETVGGVRVSVKGEREG